MPLMNAILAIVWRSMNNSGLQRRNLAMLVWRSNQQSYEAPDVGSWSFVGPNVPMMNESMNENNDTCMYMWNIEHIEL